MNGKILRTISKNKTLIKLIEKNIEKEIYLASDEEGNEFNPWQGWDTEGNKLYLFPEHRGIF
jgi:hypothetical protein